MEAGEGGASLRLGGAGVIRLDEPRLSLKLEGKRIDIDSFILSAAGRDMLSRAGAWAPPPLSFPIDLDLAVSSIGLGQEELSNLALKATLLRGRAVLDKAELIAPGQTRIALEGVRRALDRGGANGRFAIASAHPTGLRVTWISLGCPAPSPHSWMGVPSKRPPIS